MWGVPNELRDLISKKSAEKNSLRIAWESSAQFAGSSGLSEREVALLVSATARPDQLRRLIGDLGRQSKSFLDRLLKRVDASGYTLASWLAAIELVQASLLSQGRRASLGQILGYVECCAQAVSEDASSHSLHEVVAEMLRSYGFEGDEAGA